MLQLHLSDKQFHCLLKVWLILEVLRYSLNPIDHTWHHTLWPTFIGSRNHEPLLNPWNTLLWKFIHYSDVIMGMMASQITSLTIVYLTVYSGGDQRQHQSSASLAFVRGIHRWPLNSPRKWPVTRKMFPFDDIIMKVHKSSSRSGRLFHNQGAQFILECYKHFPKRGKVLIQ